VHKSLKKVQFSQSKGYVTFRFRFLGFIKNDFRGTD